MSEALDEAPGEARDEVSDNVSPPTLHDLRTPLNQIIGYSELLEEQAEEGATESLADDLRRISDAGRRMLAMLNRVGAPGEGGLAAALADPIRVETPEPAPKPVVKAGAKGEGEALILVVDDNETNRDMLARRLARQGFATDTAGDGAEALERMGERAFDLVLLDVMMPVMDGYEALRRMKEDEGLRDVPVIMISALDEMDSVVRCVELGAEDYLPKPFDATLLKARIGASLDKKRAHDREKALYDELQENFERLQALEKQRDDLTHMIVHDLRTPLSSMSMGLQTMEVMGELNDDQKEMLGISLDGARTLLGMVNGLLDVTKMESGSMSLDLADCDAGEIVAAAAGQTIQLAESGQVTLFQEIAPDAPPFRGDPEILRRTLVNLIGNAIKFTPPQGSVTIAVRGSDVPASVVFSVEDTGEGMPPEAASYIFEKFGQVESRKGGRTMSTGLGLTFCKLAVEAHGGEIGVESTLGVGSTFSFWIPVGGGELTEGS